MSSREGGLSSSLGQKWRPHVGIIRVSLSGGTPSLFPPCPPSRLLFTEILRKGLTPRPTSDEVLLEGVQFSICVRRVDILSPGSRQEEVRAMMVRAS